MATPEPESAAAPQADFVTTIIWLALLTTHFMYTGLIYFLHPPTHAASPLVTIMTAAACVAGAGALIIGGVLLGDEQSIKWVVALKAKGVTGEALEAQAMARAQSLSIVSWAMAESVTLMGLVLAFTGQLPFNRFLFFVISGVSIHLLCRPNLAEIRKSIASAL